MWTEWHWRVAFYMAESYCPLRTPIHILRDIWHACWRTLRHSDQTIFITQSHSSLIPACFTASLEPASYITQNSSSELLIPLLGIFIWTCYTLLSPSITFSLFQLKTYLFRNLHLSLFLSVGLISWLEPVSWISFAHRFLWFNSISFCLGYSYTCGRLSWPAIWSTFRRTQKIVIDWTCFPATYTCRSAACGWRSLIREHCTYSRRCLATRADTRA